MFTILGLFEHTNGVFGGRGSPRLATDQHPKVRQWCATSAWHVKPSRQLSDQLLAGDPSQTVMPRDTRA
jgi:hypothetical protein